MDSEIFRPILIKEYMGNDKYSIMTGFTTYKTQDDQTDWDIRQVRTETTK